MAQHTPGPWLIETATKGFEVATVHGVERQPTEDGLGQSWVYVRPESLLRGDEWHWPDEAEQLANAKLIAAAPDMLEALRFIAERENLMFAECSDAEEIIATARAAITKATPA